MRFLFLSYYFPPLKSVGAIRAWQWAKHLRLRKHAVTVLTTTNRHVLPQETGDLTGIETQEAYTFDYRTLSARLRPNKGNLHFGEDTKKSKASQIFIRLKNTIPFNFFLDEGGFLYIVNGIFKTIKIVKKQNITHIISSYRPYSDHFIAFCLKKIFKNKVHWTADFRDLHVDPFYGHYYGHRFQVKANHFFLKSADMITTVSTGLASQLKCFNPNTYVLRNGIDELNPSIERSISTTFNMVYTGTMYEGDGDLNFFLSVLSEMMLEHPTFASAVRIQYAGKDTTIWLNHLQKYPNVLPIFESRGLISRPEARQMQANAHINLLFTISKNEIGGVLGGKFNEYLQVRQPILVLINGVKDLEFEQIIAELNAGIVIYNHDLDWNEKQLKKFIFRCYNLWRIKGYIEPVIPIEKLESWTWMSQTQQFLENISNKNV